MLQLTDITLSGIRTFVGSEGHGYNATAALSDGRWIEIIDSANGSAARYTCFNSDGSPMNFDQSRALKAEITNLCDRLPPYDFGPGQGVGKHVPDTLFAVLVAEHEEAQKKTKQERCKRPGTVVLDGETLYAALIAAKNALEASPSKPLVSAALDKVNALIGSSPDEHLPLSMVGDYIAGLSAACAKSGKPLPHDINDQILRAAWTMALIERRSDEINFNDLRPQAIARVGGHLACNPQPQLTQTEIRALILGCPIRQPAPDLPVARPRKPTKRQA